MSNIPIVDSHVHLWDPHHLSYPWLADVPSIDRPFLASDYREACCDWQIERMVFLQCEVECSSFQREVDWVTTIANEEPRLHGIVPWAPLEEGEGARPVLERFAASPLIKGVRRLLQTEADPEYCLQPEFVQGVQMLADYDFSFDICLKPAEQMASVIQLVKRCPDVRFVLDHMGKPNIDKHEFEPWKGQLQQLAMLPNVWCKISGLVTEANPQNWNAADLQPYVDHALEVFGFDRVMFGGDWPVVTLASPLATWMETLWDLMAGCSDDDQRKLFHDNALAFYRLNS